jgi:hypothetical protein
MTLKPFLWILLVGLVACGQSPAATQSPLPASPLPAPAAGTYLYIRDTGGEVRVRFPSGDLVMAGTVLSADGRRAYSLETPPQTGKSLLVARDIPSMTVLKRLELDPFWSLPTITRTDSGAAGEPGGLSADGHWLVLSTSQGSLRSLDWPSRFLVVDTSLSRSPREVSIPGDFEFDAISDDGSRLFLIEHKSQGDYNVRLYDLVKGRLDANLIIDKLSPGERMRGNRVDLVAGSGARWLYSAYSAGGGKGFIHALGLGPSSTYAYCIDLPKSTAGNWRLALGSDRLYAFSPADGLLAEVSLSEPPKVMRTMTLPKAGAARNPFWVDAAAKETFGAAARPAVAPDGKTIYLATEQAVWVVDVPSFSVRMRLLAGARATSVAVDPDGWLYASTVITVNSSSQRPGLGLELLRVNPRTGEVADRLPGIMGSTLLRVQVLS